MSLFAVGAKILGGVARGAKKIVGNIKSRKLARVAKRDAKSATRKAQIIALGEPDRVDLDTDKGDVMTALGLGEKLGSKKPDAKSDLWPKVVAFCKENWKLVVPGAIGFAIVLIGMIYKSMKKR